MRESLTASYIRMTALYGSEDHGTMIMRIRRMKISPRDTTSGTAPKTAANAAPRAIAITTCQSSFTSAPRVVGQFENYQLERRDSKHAVADQFGDESYIRSKLMERGASLELLQTVRRQIFWSCPVSMDT